MQQFFYSNHNHCPYLIFVIFFTHAKFLENKIYTEIYTVNCQLGTACGASNKYEV